jgi:2-polyprenyl-3-methyl-5-hydroxy-6-metoxy-1,4-benzoquinol methylase
MQFENHRNLSTLVQRTLDLYPAYGRFLEKRFHNVSVGELDVCEALSADILKLAGRDLDTYCLGFDHICKIQREEEVYFRRYGDYRLKTFAQAYADVYSNKPYMTKYMHGLLLTQVLWSNHTQSIDFYEKVFLKGIPATAKLLEVGPGHGLLFAKACRALASGQVTGWDISEASLEDTQHSLDALQIPKGYSLVARDLMAPGEGSFDAIVFSEVLEHMEHPDAALRALASNLRKDGQLYINVPLNSPAPDHLFLIRSTAQLEAFVDANGMRIVTKKYLPATNYTLEQAERHALTITACVVLAHKH